MAKKTTAQKTFEVWVAVGGIAQVKVSAATIEDAATQVRDMGGDAIVGAEWFDLQVAVTGSCCLDGPEPGEVVKGFCVLAND